MIEDKTEAVEQALSELKSEIEQEIAALKNQLFRLKLTACLYLDGKATEQELKSFIDYPSYLDLKKEDERQDVNIEKILGS